MVISLIIALARKLGQRNIEMHQGQWNKVSKKCHEVRGKTLGIIGYGHIGSQVSVLAESLGMGVLFYDIMQIMPLGTAKPCKSLDDLLRQSAFVTLHVPETKETTRMIGQRELALMPQGSYLLNASRGSVVDVDALKEALLSGHLEGAAVDVFPSEPESSQCTFSTGLEGIPNLIMTPHIGGSTEEAQAAIGLEVATNIIRFIDRGCSIGCVNLPEQNLPFFATAAMGCRLLNVHRNVPGVLKVSDF